ncbi:thiamine pyrophosphate-dependent enzyme [Brevibacterium sp. UCMA 11754]|uniref:thiamine pyrophosphate-dependent enzyme n=1 Tax=Brevibacterium sp. UCMA 11754 TaxID=2749198 RepID=UPI001F15C656|nr:thiamine pyrophosphate-dependent enzyme [Brevibacterium sp. UCMA 11754]
MNPSPRAGTSTHRRLGHNPTTTSAAPADPSAGRFPSAGAAISSPDRKVVVLESDGSGMYNPQSLWTYAREQLDIVVLIFANRKYQILRNEMSNVGVPDFGPKAESLLDIGNPAIDWVSLSHGMGVPATRVETIEDLDRDFRAGLADSGPRLIEVLV